LLSEVLASPELNQTKEGTASKTIRDIDLTVCLVIDQTAARKPVVDMILKTLARPARRVVISGSHNPGYSDGHYNVPKPELISLLQAGMGWGLLKFAEEMPELKDLVDELINYQDQKTNAMPLPDEWREHPSDDLVFAVALACWALQQELRFSYEFL